jgi:hypothetical protein
LVETADSSQVALILVVVLVFEGVWLAGLTYMMWKQYLARKAAMAQTGSPGPEK